MRRRSRTARAVRACLVAVVLAAVAAITPAWAVPTITLTPACAPPGGVIRLTGSGFQEGTVVFTMEGPSAGPIQVASFMVGRDGRVDISFANTGGPAGPRLIKALATPTGTGVTPGPNESISSTSITRPGSPTTSTTGFAVGVGSSGTGGSSTLAPVVVATATLCEERDAAPPRLECIPPIGPPGFVTLAVGSGFPPNAAVTLAWRLGIGGAQTVTDDKGNLSVPVLVMHRDVLGPRELVATAGAGLLAPSASAPFLVVPATLGPPEVRGVQPELVFRR